MYFCLSPSTTEDHFIQRRVAYQSVFNTKRWQQSNDVLLTQDLKRCFFPFYTLQYKIQVDGFKLLSGFSLRFNLQNQSLDILNVPIKMYSFLLILALNINQLLYTVTFAQYLCVHFLHKKIFVLFLFLQMFSRQWFRTGISNGTFFLFFF